MTDCNTQEIQFPTCKRRYVIAKFNGGNVTSDGGGSLLLRQADRRLRLLERLAAVLPDSRRQNSCEHDLLSMLRQRVYAIGMGYEDLNDHDELRNDIAIQTAVDKDTELASSPTLCRFENQSDRKTAWLVHELIFHTFVESFEKPPEELVLDFDATDDQVHGQQVGRFFHGYYDHYCFLPLYVFCGDQLLVAYLRPSKIDGAKHAWAILSLLVKGFRKVWPNVKITFRGDGGFCRHKMLGWCENHDVKYIVGIARNKRLTRKAKKLIDKAKREFEKKGEKQRLFDTITYAANTWKVEREIIVKAEHTSKGSNPRYVVTNLEGDPQELYDKLYCARGEMENRIKEQQLYLFADRTSCHKWYANQFRLLLSSLAYVLVEAIRRLALHGTELARAQCGTIRLKLMKIGGIIIRNTRRIRFLLSSAYPYKELFCMVAARLRC